MEFLSYWAEIGEMIADFSCKGKLSIGPQKFFKIQWIQSQDIKVVDGERIRVNHTFIDRGNVILWKVQGNRGKKCGNLRNALDIVKNQKGRGRAQWFSCTGFQKKQYFLWIMWNRQIVCSRAVCFQIDVECMFVLLISEVHKQPGLACLAKPLKD